ncbi:unnamed protein product [Citrullus colocynthis]|uniref:KNOX1 domain-containing protein n=1 Tax=Citrullus colocynthis TaxID=252529 RepID=A0ABP0Y0Q4_9ROSI
MKSENDCTEERQEAELKGLQDEDEEEEEEGWGGEMLRRRISSHPLYGLLVETHLNCLKETYCFALSKLKEAMEESQLKSMAFINRMHWQLRELTTTGAAATAKKPTTSSSNDKN